MEEHEREEIPANEQQDQEVQDQNTFDADAFMRGDESSDDVDTVVEQQQEEHSESELSESTDNVSEEEELTWSMFSDEVETPQEEAQEESQEESQSEQETVQEETQEEVVEETSSNSYEDLTEDLGFEVKSKDDIVSKFKALQEENQNLKRSGSSLLNDKAKSYQKLLKLSDEELYKVQLKGQGLSDEKVQAYTEDALNKGILEREADVFRAKVNRAIDSEIASEEQAQMKAIETAQQEEKENRKIVRDYINSQEEMFGMKMAKDPKKLEATRKELSSYILDGKFMKEIGSNPENLSQVAWLWKHRDVIMKGFQNRGVSQGKAEFIKTLKNPSSVSQSNSRRELSDDDNLFNADAFIAG